MICIRAAGGRMAVNRLCLCLYTVMRLTVRLSLNLGSGFVRLVAVCCVCLVEGRCIGVVGVGLYGCGRL